MSEDWFDGELAAENLYKRISRKIQIKEVAISYMSKHPDCTPEQLHNYLVKYTKKTPKKPKKD